MECAATTNGAARGPIRCSNSSGCRHTEMTEAILHLPGIRRLSDCIRYSPDYMRSRWKWTARRFLDRWYLWPCTVEDRNGAKFILRKDRIADQILMDLNSVYAPLFFPSDLREIPDGGVILDLGAH